MYAAEVACDCDAGNILPVEGEHARRLRTEPCGSFRGRYISMEILMLTIICSNDLCQEACYHLDNICNRHSADLVLLPAIHSPSQRMSGWVARPRQDFLTGEALYMAEISNFDAARRVGG